VAAREKQGSKGAVVRNPRIWSSLVTSAFVLAVGIASAQTADPPASGPQSPPSARPESFGTDCCDVLQIPAAAFVPRASNIDWDYEGFGYIAVTLNPNSDKDVFWAPVQLPTGARVRLLELFYYDGDATNDISATLRGYTGAITPGLTTIATVSSSGAPGYTNAFSSFVDYTVPNGSTQHAVVINIPSATSNLRFKGASVSWQRQISPAPANPTFGDVPTDYPYFRGIEALARSGITGGCGSGNFCPQQFVTRGEMATFLARALGLHFNVPPS
jgi:hypothetical protein